MLEVSLDEPPVPEPLDVTLVEPPVPPVPPPDPQENVPQARALAVIMVSTRWFMERGTQQRARQGRALWADRARGGGVGVSLRKRQPRGADSAVAASSAARGLMTPKPPIR